MKGTFKVNIRKYLENRDCVVDVHFITKEDKGSSLNGYYHPKFLLEHFGYNPAFEVIYEKNYCGEGFYTENTFLEILIDDRESLKEINEDYKLWERIEKVYHKVYGAKENKNGK